MAKSKFSLGDILKKLNEESSQHQENHSSHHRGSHKTHSHEPNRRLITPEFKQNEDVPQEVETETQQNIAQPKFTLRNREIASRPERTYEPVNPKPEELEQPQAIQNTNVQMSSVPNTSVKTETVAVAEPLPPPQVQAQNTPNQVSKLLFDESEDGGGEFDIFKYVAVIIRRRNIIGIVGILFTCIALYQYLKADKYYTAKARLLFNPKTESLLGDGVRVTFGDREKMFTTHLELLQSNTVLSRLSDNLESKISAPQIRSGLLIKQGETNGIKNDIIEITFKNQNPELTRDVVNELLKTYIEYRREVNSQEITRLLFKLETQIIKTKAELDLKESDLRRFKEDNRLAQLSSETNLTIQKISNMELALQSTQLGLIEGEEKLKAINTQMSKQEQQVVESITYSNPIKGRLAGLELELNSALAEYSPEHFKVKMIKQEIETLKKATIDSAQEAASKTFVKNPIRQSLLQEYINLTIERTVLETKRAAQEQLIAQLNQDLLKLPSLEQRHASLERETESLLQTLRLLKSKYEETKIKRDSQESDLSVSELAETPRSPISSVKFSTIFLGLLVGLIFGIVIAFLIEYLDQSLKDARDVERVLELPLLGIVPLIEAEKGLVESSENLQKNILEPFRALRANLKHIATTHHLKTIIICSAVKGEGKTTLAANLAITFSLDGRKVILVDGDLRRSQMHTLFNIPKEIGLTDYLLATKSIDEILKPTKFENLFLVTSGERPDNPAELLGTIRFDNFVKEIRGYADIIIFDSPALLPVSDSISMAPKMDGCVIVTRTLWTPLKGAMQAKNQLQRIGCKIYGGILNGVSQSRNYYPYYYGYYGYYGYYSYRYGYEDDQPRKFSIREAGLAFEKKLRSAGIGAINALPRIIANVGLTTGYLFKRKSFWILLLLLGVLTGLNFYLSSRPKKSEVESTGIQYLGFMTNDERDSFSTQSQQSIIPLENVNSSFGKSTNDNVSIVREPVFLDFSVPALSDTVKSWVASESRGDTLHLITFYDKSFKYIGGDLPAWKIHLFARVKAQTQRYDTIFLDTATQVNQTGNYYEIKSRYCAVSDRDTFTISRSSVWNKGPSGWRIIREKEY